jgi:cyclopropane fatty-acyl-phospholipid synthase-like methyltransferase
MLADVMASSPVPPETSLLELGAGLGAPGLVAAAKGYRVTLSDYEPHILDFQRVSAAASGLSGIEHKIIDWKNPKDMPQFDRIIGAEILFRDEFFEPLLKLFGNYLAPQGEIYIAHDIRRKSVPQFLARAEKEYEIGVSARKMRSEDKELTILVNRLRRRS